MVTEQAFLQAIRDQPHALDHYRVYGDWLQDQGDPRGEFIVAQCQLSRMKPSDPAEAGLRTRCHHLQLRHEADWLGPMLGQLNDWEFKHGLFETISVECSTFLAHAERWLPALPILGVHLRRVGKHVAKLAACPQLAHVTGLYLGDNSLSDDDLAALVASPHLRRLRVLYLQSNNLSAAACELLANAPNLCRLQDVSLANNPVEDAGIAALIAGPGLRHLKRLTISMTRLRDLATLRALARSQLYAGLHRLYLTGSFLPEGFLKALVEPPGPIRLRGLIASMSAPGEEDLLALAASPHAAKWEHLALGIYGGAMSERGIQAIAASPHLGNLRWLDLELNTLTPGMARALAGSRTLRHLRDLGIHSNDSDGSAEGNAILLGSPRIRRLASIRLMPGGVLDQQALRNLVHHPAPLQLRQLSLQLDNEVTPAWNDLLTQGSLVNLTDLDIEDAPKELVEALLVEGRLPRLRHLSLSGNFGPSLDWSRLLSSPLFGQLESFEIGLAEAHGLAFLRHLVAHAPNLTLQKLTLRWSLRSGHVDLLTSVSDWGSLTSLGLTTSWFKERDTRRLARWPLLGRLRSLRLSSGTVQELPGLMDLVRSGQIGPLLKVDLYHGNVTQDSLREIRTRYAARWSINGRKYPRVLTLGSRAFGTGDLGD